MVKLLACLLFGLALSAAMLELRQEALNLNYQTSRLHSQIEARQAELWSQQLRIAEVTAPNAIAARVRQDNIPLAPAARPDARNWIDPPPPPAPASSAD
ncbi:MAG: hypothetical protein ABSH22_06180 [Tepidisphaeraceae bacterium]|jgi:cell division protein FtsL